MRDGPRRSRGARRRRGPELRGCLTLALEARVKDLSLSGMAVECGHRLQPQRRYRFRLGHAENATELTGHVVWCFLKETRPGAHGEMQRVYRAGLEIEDVLSERARELFRFLEANALLTLETRLCGRFALRAEEMVHLSSEVEFQARSLSTAGMLIETEASAEPGTPVSVELESGDQSVRLAARVAYLRRLDEGETERSEMGLEFAPLTEEQRALVGSLVSRFEAASGPPAGSAA